MSHPDQAKDNWANALKTVYSADGYHVIELDSFEGVWKFVGTLREKSSDDYVFRGQSDASHPLETSLTRCLKKKEENERRVLRHKHMRTALFELRGRVGFQSELADCLDAVSKLKDMSISTSHGNTNTQSDPASTQIEAEFWAFAQHYGLWTPLLDWTLAPGVALFFAIEREKNISRQMASVFAINQTLVSKERDSRASSLDFVTPIRLANPRISAQRGLFTLCARDIPVEDWISDAFKGRHDSPALFKLIFPVTERDRRQCLRDLRDRNITHSSVYPDVQGATDHANLLLTEELKPVSDVTIDKSIKGSSKSADIELGGKTLELHLERDANNKIILIKSAQLFTSRWSSQPTRERWLVKAMRPPLDDVDKKTDDQSAGWAFRAGCAYKLINTRNKNEFLFLKTPDKRHFTKGSLADIRASFAEEEKSLRALNEEPRGENELRVAKVLASIELAYTPEVAKSLKLDLPEDGKFPALIHEFISDGEPLDVLLNQDRPLTVEEWLALAFSLTDTLRRVHNSSVLHAAIAHRHVLVKNLDVKSLEKARLVGFGSSSLLSEAGTSNASFSRPKSPWLAPEVHEAEDLLGPLSFSTDIYSLGMVLLFAATHKTPDQFDLDKNQHTVLLKRKVTELLSREIGKQPNPLSKRHDIAKIIDTCLRHDPNERYSCMEELLDAIETAKEHKTVPSPITLTGSLKQIQKITKKKNRVSDWEKLHPFFQRLLQRQVDRVHSDFIAKIKRGHYEVYGSRNTLIDYLCNFMNLVEVGGVYRTVTLPGYWTDRNLGSDGRFLAKNKDLLVKKVTVERVFLVSGAFHTLPYSEQQVLLAHYSAWSALNGEFRDKFNIRVCVEQSKPLMSFEKGGQAVAIINPKGSLAISLRFLSTGKRYQYGGEYFIDRDIIKLRFKVITEEQFADEQERMGFGVYFQKGVSIDTFIRQRETEATLAMIASLSK